MTCTYLCNKNGNQWQITSGFFTFSGSFCQCSDYRNAISEAACLLKVSFLLTTTSKTVLSDDRPSCYSVHHIFQGRPMHGAFDTKMKHPHISYLVILMAEWGH